MAFADCMTAHGIPTTPGSSGRGFEIHAPPSSPQFPAAEAACRKLLPGGGPKPLTPSQQALRTKDLIAFSACVRAHHVPSFPDPDPDNEFAFPDGTIKLLTSPLGEAAFKTCHPLFPKLGPQISPG